MSGRERVSEPAGRDVALAIILARAGSKGAPGKNAATVGGRPCAWWTIAAAARAETLDVVAVSTDDRRVAEVARQEGVIALDRPAELATDTATVDDAARHALAALDGLLGRPAQNRDAVVILYANVPVRPEGLIDRAVELLRRTGADSVQSYAPVGKHHPWWTARLAPDSASVSPWQGEVLNHGVFRRQDLPPAFVPDGGVLAVTRRALERRMEAAGPAEAQMLGGPHGFLGLDRRGVVTGEGEVVDIDSPIDLVVADALLRARATAAEGARA